MWKILLLIVFLSVDAQKPKMTQRNRDGIKISDLCDMQPQQETFSYRLPNETIPELYLINMNFGDFHIGDLSFTGNVLISIRVVENTDEIVLHSSGLQVVDTMLTTSANVDILHSTRFVIASELLIVKTSVPILKDSIVRLTINYQGTIDSSIAGAYRGSYLHNGSDTRYHW